MTNDHLDNALRQHFGFDSFRSGQREVLENILARQHTLAVLPTGLGKSLCYQLAAQMLHGITLVISPLIALMQDQVEALVNRGCVNATYLNSALSAAEIGARFTDIERGRYKLVYVAPERFDSPRFQQLVRQFEISLLVIDEAHCISQWGHDFRPHYRNLLDRLPELKQATLLALTATATPHTQDDIAATLQLPSLARVIGNLNRPNLRFEATKVHTQEEKNTQLLQMLSQEKGAAIVYASTRREAENVHRLLRKNDVNSCLYHAGLEPEHRAISQRQFQQGNYRVMVATIAFGMGIDKADIRRVIHYNLPASLEHYYQEAGRAGRDGEAAACSLFYWQPDVRTQRFFVDSSHPDPKIVFHLYEMLYQARPLPVSANDLMTASGFPELAVNAALQLLYEQHHLSQAQDGKYLLTKPDERRPQVDFRVMTERRKLADERLKKMIEYAAGRLCRRVQILNYFGQKYEPPCEGCDVCGDKSASDMRPDAGHMVTAMQEKNPSNTGASIEASEASDRVARIILQAVLDFGGRFGRSIISGVLVGSKRKNILEWKLDKAPSYGALALHSGDRALHWIDELIERQLLETTAEEYPRLVITQAGRQALASEARLPLSGFAVRRVLRETTADDEHRFDAKTSDAVSAQLREVLTERLKQWRLEKSKALALPPFMILHNRVIEEISTQQPQKLVELRAIKGIGQSIAEKFGAEILTMIHEVVGEVETMQSTSDQSEGAPDTTPKIEQKTDDTSATVISREPLVATASEVETTGDYQSANVQQTPDLWLQIEIWRQNGDPPDATALLKVLENYSALERGGLVMVINALKDLRVTQAAEVLMKLMRETTDGNLISVICAALGQLTVKEAAPELLALLADNRAGVRRAAIRALGHLREPSALQKLEHLADKDDSDSVRLAAHAAVWLIKTPRR